MLVLINKYLRSKDRGAGKGEHGMPAESNGGDNHMCIPGCVPVRGAKRSSAAATTVTTTTTTTTTARTSRHNFVKAAAAGCSPARSSPTTSRCRRCRTRAPSSPPRSRSTARSPAGADAVRREEYGHLDRHVCLDYTGINLFSHAQMNASLPSTSASSAAAPAWWQPPFFDIAYKSTSLRTQVQCEEGGAASAGNGVGAAMTRRIMASLKIPEDEYTMVCTANRTTAFRLLAESYSFQSGGKQLLTVYDYESEAAGAMAAAARRRGADVSSATFAWPSMRIHAADLRKKLSRGRRRGRGGNSGHRGLFVFPLASRMTGARYPYLWMSAAHERGWHVALDACALGTKDLDTFGVSLLRPDFIVCNFFKCSARTLPDSRGCSSESPASPRSSDPSSRAASASSASSPPAMVAPRRRGYSTELDHSLSFPKLAEDADVDTSCSFSGPLSRSQTLQADDGEDVPEIREAVDDTAVEPEAEAAAIDDHQETEEEEVVVECRGLDHADALG
ncbi:hypothetical protein EJB05_47842, partial [Eragrostis curvula]